MFCKISAFLIGLLAIAPSARAVQHQVTVGGPGVLRYDPEYVTAAPGDTVLFSFKQENHTVTQSTLESPCEITENGFDSGFIPVAANNTDGPFPAAQFTVEDTNPVWVFCRQVGHCQQGMVFAINPGNQFATFQATAMGNITTSSSTSSPVASSSASIPSSPSNSSSFASSLPATSSASASTPSASAPTAAGVVTVTATVIASSAVSTAPSSSSTSSAFPATSTSSDHVVIVGGNGQLTYEPSNITADVGDTITFRFAQANHSVTQSSFSNPCVSLTDTSTNGQVGFDSGFMPVASNAASDPTFTIQVNNTAPIWAYCKQTNPKSHCGAGMVFSVNAVASSANNFAAFQDKAKQINGTTADASTSSGVGRQSISRSAGAAALVFGIIVSIMI